jgi:hypothetical protein
MKTRIKLDDFTAQYINTALWSSVDDSGEALDKKKDMTHIDEMAMKQMIDDCRKFQEDNWDLISDDVSKAGHDFWLTRNGHGAGFWDGDWPKEIGEELTRISKSFGTCDLFVSDDGLIFVI